MHSTEDSGAEEETEDVALGELSQNRFLVYLGDFAIVDVGNGFAKRPFVIAVDLA